MIIGTKFNIGDNIWFMIDNKPKQTTVTKINIFVRKEETIISYDTQYNKNIYEEEACSSKEELIKYLFK